MCLQKVFFYPAGLPWSWRGGDGHEGLARVAAEAAAGSSGSAGARAGPPPRSRCPEPVSGPQWAVQGEQRWAGSCHPGSVWASPSCRT